MRFDFLTPKDDDPPVARDPLWGRFPPECCYNMDQVPLPFVVGQECTFTTEDGNDVNIKCSKESLRRRQFTMHLVFNAGEGEKGHGWYDLVCRGTGTRINQGEKELWNDNVKMYWQKKAWVDNVVMRQLARRFVEHKKQYMVMISGYFYFVTT